LVKWIKAGLWGNPMRLGPDKFHVYGANRRNWHRLDVEFLPDKIVVLRHQ
jgi:cbb3-type cytochrome oxidase cytochrome c subunit